MNRYSFLRGVLLSCLACSMVFVPVVVTAAPMLYTYTGNYFDYDLIEDSIDVPGEYTTSDRVEIEILTLDGYLSDRPRLRQSAVVHNEQRCLRRTRRHLYDSRQRDHAGRLGSECFEFVI